MNNYRLIIVIAMISGCSSSENNNRPGCTQTLLDHVEKAQFADVARETSSFRYIDSICDLSVAKKKNSPILINLNLVFALSDKIQKALDKCTVDFNRFKNNDINSSTDDSGVDTTSSCEDGEICKDKLGLDALADSEQRCGAGSSLDNDQKELESIFEVKFQHKIFSYTDQISSIKEKIESDEKKKKEEKLAAELNEATYKNSEESFYDRACSFNNIKKIHSFSLKREKDAAAISGVSNKKNLYDLGHQILMLNDLIERENKNYFAKFNKKLDLTKCKKSKSS